MSLGEGYRRHAGPETRGAVAARTRSVPILVRAFGSMR